MGLEQLIKKCQEYDVKAQEALYRRFAPLLLGVCIKYCGDKALAQDLFQESFITIYNKIPQFKHQGSFEGWAKRVTINTVLAYYRKQRFLLPINEERTEEIEDDNFEETTTFSLDVLLDAIQKLPNQYRLVFNMYALDNYSHKEIAKALSISEGTSKSNLSRARSILKKELQKIERKEEYYNE